MEKCYFTFKNVETLNCFRLKRFYTLLFLSLMALSGQLVQAQTLQTNTYNNNTTFTVPAGVTQINVQAWGGGGAGGGCNNSGNSGSGGGAGGYLLRNDITVIPAANHAVVVGANGDGFSNANGTSGQPSTIASLTLTANGGTFGRRNGGAAGTGGTAIGGTINTTGGNGNPGGTNIGGNGGSAANGGAGGLGVSNNDGMSGAIPGGGGGGGESSGSNNESGGGGGKGRVIITYFLPPVITTFTASGCPGTTITITGTNFTGVNLVTFFNGITAIPLTVTATQITVVVPIGATSGPIRVSRPSGFGIRAGFVVNSLAPPSAITGNTFICPTFTTTLSSSPTGGIWSSANTSVANVNGATGLVTAVGSGTSVITYTITSGNCTSSISTTVTVYSIPNISGPSLVCPASTIQLTAGTGSWSISNATIALVSASGLVTGLSPGTATVTFTDSTTGCVATKTITVQSSPSITSQPAASQLVCSGNNAVFQVVASGQGLTYQWYNGVTPLANGGNITGATTDLLTIFPVSLSDAAPDYHVVVSGTCAPPVVSANSALSVNEAVAIVTPPAITQSICEGGTALFSVAATGTGLTYQWFNGLGNPLSDGGNISGANTSQLTISAALVTDASANYFVVVTGTSPCLPVTSSNAELIVNNDPLIQSQPLATQTVCAGDSVSLSLFATGGGLTYQWYKGATLLTDGGNISGTATNTLNFLPISAADAAPDYHCVVSNGCGVDADSAFAEVLVNASPAIPSQFVSTCSETGFVLTPADGVPLGTIVPANTTYTWTSPIVTGGLIGGNAQPVAQSFIGETLVNPTNAPQTATYLVTPRSGASGLCTGTPFTLTVTVDPLPVINNITTGICSGEILSLTPANGGGNIVPIGTVYSWGMPSITGGLVGATAETGQNAFTQTLYNPTNTVQTATYNVTATSGSCASTTFTIAVTVNPKPNVSGAFATQPVCSGALIIPITLSNPNNVPGITAYNWTRDNTVNVIGMAASGTGDTISGTLTNTTGALQIVTFTLYATSEDGCISLPSTITVMVYPVPVPVVTPVSQAVCSGNAITPIILSTSNGVSGTAFDWTRDNTANLTGIAPNGSGNISGTLTNTTNTPQTTTFMLTASANGCSAITTFAITVNPAPAVSAAPLTQTVCGGDPFSITALDGNAIAGTVFSFTKDSNVAGDAVAIVGNVISGSLANNSGSNRTVTFTITAAANGCLSTTTVQVIVKPNPIFTLSPFSQTVCNGVPFTTINFPAVAGVTYSWTRTNPMGSGNLTGLPDSAINATSISGTLTNLTTANQTTTFTVTATINGCVRTATASITVYPPLVTPVISASQTVCILSTPATLVMSTPVSGGSGAYTYQWQRADENDIVTNTWTNVGSGTTYSPPAIGFGGTNYYYRLVVTNVCGTVNSNVVFVQVISSVGFTFDGVNDPATQCPGGTFTTNISSDHATSSAVRYSYTANASYITPPSGSNLGTTGPIQYLFFFFPYRSSSASLPFTVQNNTNATVTTQITITPSVYTYGPPIGAFQCSITPQIVNVTIRPRPVATIVSPAPSPAPITTICSGTSPNVTVSGNITDAVMSYAWTRNNTANVTSPTNSGNSGSIAIGGTFTIPFALTNITTTAQNVVYTITPVSNGCSGTAVTVTVTVNPQLTPGVVAASQTICSGGDPVAFTQTTAAAGINLSYQWQSGPSATGPWTNIAGATATTYDEPGPLTANTWYIRVVTSTLGGFPCAVQNTTPVAVTINNIAPGIVSGGQTICSGGNPAIFTSTAATGIGAITYQWEYSTTDCNGPWLAIGGNVQNLDVPAGLLATTYYRRRATAATGSCSQYSNCIVVFVNNVLGGTVGTDQTICGNNPAAFAVITPATGAGALSYQWQSNTTGCGGSFANIGGATLATYDAPAGLTQTTYYKRVATSLYNSISCTADSNCITVTVNTVSAGVISGNRTVCNGGDPAAFTVTTAATGTSLTYQWQSSTTGGVGTYSDIAGATAATYDVPGPVTQIMYYQRIAFSQINSVTCSAISNFVTVFVNNAVAPVIAGSQSVCTEDPAAFTTITPASGNGSTLSYQWQTSNGSCSGPWTNVPGAAGTAAIYDPPIVSQTTYYRVLFTSILNAVSCTNSSNCVVVTFNSKTWNGSLSTDWNVPNNWTPAGVPTSAHCVVVPNTVLKPIISGSGYIGYGKNLSILNGGRLDVNTTNNVFITNFVNVSPTGIFNIANNASLVQTDNVANTGTVNVQRITPPMYRFDYTYWNSPMVMGAYTLGNLSPNTQYDKYYSWNPTNAGNGGNWIQESTATIMNPLKGYIIRAPNSFSFTPDVTQPYTATFTGTPNNGDLLIPISVGTLGPATSNDKMNLIGNPYPSAVSANAFLNHTGNATLLDGTIYFWTHHAPPSAAFANPFYGNYALNYSPNGYASYNALGGTNTVPAGFGGTPPNGFIGVGQSFFAKGIANGNALFENAMRVTGNNNVFFRTANASTPATEFESHRLWLNFADTQGTFSQILVGYADGATNDMDRNFDGESLNSGNAMYSLLEGKNLAIQGRALPFEENDQVPLGYAAAAPRTYTIGIDYLDVFFEEQPVYLEDKWLNVIHDLKVAPYAFASAAGTFNDRFILRYTNAALGLENPDNTVLTAFIKDKILVVAAADSIKSIQVFDITGKLVKTYVPNVPSGQFESEFQFAEGIYLAKIKLVNDIIVTSKLANGN